MLDRLTSLLYLILCDIIVSKCAKRILIERTADTSTNFLLLLLRDIITIIMLMNPYNKIEIPKINVNSSYEITGRTLNP